MQFHWCGNPFHDLIHNLFILLVMTPEWLPSVRGLALKWLARRHKH